MIRRIIKKLQIVLLCLLLTGLTMPQPVAAASDNFCNMVVFVKFADDSTDVFNAAGNKTSLLKMYNGTETNPDYSFKNYIKTISDSQLLVDNYMPQFSGSTVSTLTLKYAASAYTDDWPIVDEVIAAVNSGVISADFSQHRPDYRQSGCLDNLTIIIQGSASLRSDLIYPHKSVYAGEKEIAAGKAGNAVPIAVYNYNVIDSESLVSAEGSSDTSFYGNKQGVIAHEFMHSLGLADLYCYSGSTVPVGIWSLMASAGPFLQYPLTYSRSLLGWLSINKITAAGTYTLNNTTKSNGDRAFILTTPLSTSEFFVVEYRRKETAYASSGNIGFETKIPESGLLVYRVNNALTERTNAQGNNFIYVFRPDEAELNGGSDVTKAAVTVNDGGYGTTDLQDAYTDNTIYYSSGVNSGISISNLSLSADGSQATFDVTFADYSTLDLWAEAGPMPLGTGNSDVALAADGDDVICGWEENTVSSSRIQLRRYSADTWSVLGSPVDNANSARLAVFDNSVYLLCLQPGSGGTVKPTVYRYENSAWKKLWQDADCLNSADLFGDETGLYASYVSTDNALVIKNALTGAAVTTSLTADQFANPALACFEGSIYAAYSDFGGSSHQTVVQRYDLAAGSWSRQTSFALNYSNSHALAAADGKLYLYAASGSGHPIFSVCEDSVWTPAQSLSFMTNCLDVRLAVYNKKTYLAYWESSSAAAKVMVRADEGWQQVGGTVLTAAGGMDFVIAGNAAYAAVTENGTDSVFVKTKALADSADYDITVTVPAGYDDTVLWIDGQAKTAAAAGSALTVTADDGKAQTVTMYRYSSAGVPTGMYAWTLSYSGGHYTVKPQPQLEDLLTYHGFSVRVAGQSGIRFKTGIAVELRSRLTAGSGAAGFKLKEYGTLVMTSANMNDYPLVKDGAKTACGRAYWLSAGKVNDAVFETVGGRYRFTSVLIGIPAASYKTKFAFRGYIQLVSNGTVYTFYGPVVARSIYEVSSMVIASGQFAAGSSADLFLRRIITDADRIG